LEEFQVARNICMVCGFGSANDGLQQWADARVKLEFVILESLELSQRHTMLVFLKLHQTEGRISSNLLKRKQSSRKTSIVCRWL